VRLEYEYTKGGGTAKVERDYQIGKRPDDQGRPTLELVDQA
jgi:hypothetical protein